MKKPPESPSPSSPRATVARRGWVVICKRLPGANRRAVIAEARVRAWEDLQAWEDLADMVRQGGNWCEPAAAESAPEEPDGADLLLIGIDFGRELCKLTHPAEQPAEPVYIYVSGVYNEAHGWIVERED